MKIIFGFATVLLAASLTVAGVVQAQQSSKLPPAAGSVKMTANAENKTRKDAAPKAVSPVPAPESAETSEQFFFEYLLSELANQRGETAIAESGLLGLSKRFGDPRLARRATEVALQSGQMEQAYEATILWLEVEPHSPMARQILGRMAGSDLASSKTSLSKWLGVSKTPVVITRATPIIFMQLPAILARFVDKNAEKSAEKNAEKSGDKNNYIQTVRELAKPFPRLAEAHHAVAQAELIGGNNAYALAAIDEAIQLKSGWSQAAILKSQILRGAKSESAEQNALDFLQGFLTANPAASDARLIYARLLAAQKSYLSSREEFRKIDQDNVNKKINDPESSYAIALISQQMEDYAEAEKQFLRTLDAKPYDSNPVYFNLGAHAGSTTSARADEPVRNMSTAIVRRAPASPRRARSVSGKSASGSAPTSTRQSILPSAAACSAPRVSSPPAPGRIPTCRAPTELPRRNAGSTFVPGVAAKSWCNACTLAVMVSARLARPKTTTTLPFANCAATSLSASASLTTATCEPGS